MSENDKQGSSNVASNDEKQQSNTKSDSSKKSGKKSDSSKTRTKGVKVYQNEVEAFIALTECIKGAKTSVLTTRLSAHEVDLSKDHLRDFNDALTNALEKKDYFARKVKRIVVTNLHEKLNGVLSLIKCEGKVPLSLYLIKKMGADYNFEVVVIDNNKAFVLYRDNDTPDSDICSYSFFCENDAFVTKEYMFFDMLTKEAEKLKKEGDAMIIEKTGENITIYNRDGKEDCDISKALHKVEDFFKGSPRKKQGKDINENNISQHDDTPKSVQ